MVSIDDLLRIVGEVEGRLRRQFVDDFVQERLAHDLKRAELYLKAVRTGHADLIPDRRVRELLQRYSKPDDTADGDDDTEPSV